MSESRNGVQEELDGTVRLAAAIAGGMASKTGRLDAEDLPQVANLANILWKRVFHVVMAEGEEGG